MYQPIHLRETRAEVQYEPRRTNPFATQVERATDGLSANHQPLEQVDGVLHRHVVRGNELAKNDAAEVSMIFRDADCYISPNSYPSKRVTGREVPTCIYAVVRVHAHMRAIEGPQWLCRLRETLTNRHEAGQLQPRRVDDARADCIEATLRGIVGGEVAIERIEGKFRLSQNHPEANRRGVIDGLRQRDTESDAALAALMDGQHGAGR